MSRWSLGLLLWAAALLAAGCRAPSPDPLERYLIQPATAGALDFTIQWQQELSIPRGERLTTVTPLDQRVVATDSTNLATVISDDDGSVAWQQNVAGPTGRVLPPVQIGDAIGLSTRTRLYVHDAKDGELRRTISYRQLADTAPVVAGPYLVYGSVKGSLVAQSVREGILGWTYQLRSRVTAGPIVADGAVIACGGDGEIVAIRPQSGNRRWEARVYRQVSARPAVGDGKVFVASEDHNLYAIDLRSGQIQWKYPTNFSLTAPPKVIGGLVLQHVPEKGVVALSTDGEVQWTVSGDLGRLQKHGDSILMHQRGRVDKILFVRQRDGRIARKVPISKVQRIVSPTRQAGPMYLLRDGGRIMKISPAP